ncbi:sugar ABC transporter substrate-binding protein, partial [Microvirga sp. 3-52]|nr:sugar ABC transporter substrate-binding protein [Microvirga sp. 3-52]
YDLVVFLDSMGSSVTQFLEPLDDYAAKDEFNIDRWPSSILELSTFDDKLYSLPVRAHVQMLFYRQDIFDKLNLTAPTTWKEFENASKIITEQTDMAGVVPYYGAGNNGQNLFMWTSYLWSNGGEIFNEDMKPIFNSVEGLEATQRYLDLLIKDKVAPGGSVTFGEQDSRTYFKQGKAAMWLGWWWVYSEFNNQESAAPEVAGNVNYAPVPGWEGKEASSNVSTFPIAMMKGSKNKDAAWEVLKWISEPEEELDIVTKTWKDEIPSKEASTVITQID